ncbi:hypothetical protein THAOC_21154 [Thalassiosira oceanica]|uniref:Uncharacterized protein n=1 Tax=Thalassiosira oceanica TaxID=159749 RepID=K0RY89_THAOC|nr:hypothetical protein THAOC_21154 [Thalassiosira oceanica]|eukprot:EJK58698.1 hypothetical protein THAOC_21154 [Thalassiosira oceanica]
MPLAPSTGALRSAPIRASSMARASAAAMDYYGVCFEILGLVAGWEPLSSQEPKQQQQRQQQQGIIRARRRDGETARRYACGWYDEENRRIERPLRRVRRWIPKRPTVSCTVYEATAVLLIHPI